MTQGNAPEQRWLKIDLHIHTPASEDYAERDISYLQILREAEQRGLEIIAFTDHNTVAGYEQMQREVEFLEQLERTRRAMVADHQQLDEYLRLLRKITVLPGFEFTSHYGAHILAVFPPTTSVSVLDATLLKLGVPPQQLKEGSTGVPDTAYVTEAYETIAKAGGLVIGAHANGPNGVITETLRMGTSGQARIAATQSPYLSALEFINFYTDHGTFTSPGFYNGKTEHYERRMHCIQGSDAHRMRRAPSGSDAAQRHGIGDRYFEALLPEPSFAALKALFASSDWERIRVPKRDQKQWDIDQMRFGIASDRNIFREAQTDLQQLLHDVVALCNMGGGTLVLGPSTSGGSSNPVSPRPAEVSEQLRLLAEQQIEPVPMLSLELVRYDSRDVVRIEVRAAQAPPYMTQGQVWLRREAQTVTAHRADIIQLARRALAESGSSPLDTGQDWDLPRSGVEIVDAQRRNGDWQYEIRDLRTMPNVVRERAQGLWAYAIDRQTDLREGRADLESQIKWVGQLGLWRMYRQGNLVKYDLVHRDANGIIDHVFYGVTDWGLSAEWLHLLQQVQGSDVPPVAPAQSENGTAQLSREGVANLVPQALRSITAGDGAAPSNVVPPSPPPPDGGQPRIAPRPEPIAGSPVVAQPSGTDRNELSSQWSGRKIRWRGRGGLLCIRRSPTHAPTFDLVMRDETGSHVQQFLDTPREKLNDRWLALIIAERPTTGIEVVSHALGEDGLVRLSFRDLRTGDVSAPWRIAELKEGSLREYAARTYNLDQQLDENTVRWWGNLGYLRPMRSQVDLVYRDADGVDHFFYACRREELRGEWRAMLEVWEDAPPANDGASRLLTGDRPAEPSVWGREQPGDPVNGTLNDRMPSFTTSTTNG